MAKSSKKSTEGERSSTIEVDINRSEEKEKETDKCIITPHDNDVVSGRGSGANRHVGNANFRDLVKCNKELYLSLSKHEKMAVARDILHVIEAQDPPGRFLQKNPETNLWFEIGKSRALEKISQALREKPPLYIRQAMKAQQHQQQAAQAQVEAQAAQNSRLFMDRQPALGYPPSSSPWHELSPNAYRDQMTGPSPQAMGQNGPYMMADPRVGGNNYHEQSERLSQSKNVAATNNYASFHPSSMRMNPNDLEGPIRMPQEPMILRDQQHRASDPTSYIPQQRRQLSEMEYSKILREQERQSNQAALLESSMRMREGLSRQMELQNQQLMNSAFNSSQQQPRYPGDLLSRNAAADPYRNMTRDQLINSLQASSTSPVDGYARMPPNNPHAMNRARMDPYLPQQLPPDQRRVATNAEAFRPDGSPSPSLPQVSPESASLIGKRKASASFEDDRIPVAHRRKFADNPSVPAPAPPRTDTSQHRVYTGITLPSSLQPSNRAASTASKDDTSNTERNVMKEKKPDNQGLDALSTAASLLVSKSEGV